MAVIFINIESAPALEHVECIECGQACAWWVPEWDLTPLHCGACLYPSCGRSRG
ncbi:MAG: hypothetical protein ABIQ18_39705 [Umezawaea sp.]